MLLTTNVQQLVRLLILVTWEPVLQVVPKGIRALSFSQRGYKNSTPLTADEASCKTPPKDLHRTHTADFAAFIKYVGETLGVPKRSADGGGITSVYWSKGCSAATGLFYFQRENPEYKSLIDTYLSSVVLYEAPTTAVFGLSPDATGTAMFYGPSDGEDPGFRFAKYVTGFYHNSAEYLAQKGGPQILKYYRAGALEENFQQYSAKAYEGEFLPSILHWFLADEKDRYEACHDAFREMARSSLKKIGILWGSEGPPECLEGSWLAEKWLKEEEQKTGEKKVATKQYEGGNHYIQFYDPKGFWDSVLEISA